MKAYNNYSVCTALWDKSFPSHWEILPMYAVAEEKSICNCVDLPLLSVYLDVGVIPFSEKAEKRTNATSKDLSKYQRVDSGDFVLNNQQAWRGSVGVSFHTGIVSPAYIVLAMNNRLNSRYANYLFRSRIMVDQYLINSKSVGSIQRNIYWPALKRTRVLVPPKDEQEQIVKFLDWKVSSVNKLISNYRREISLLSDMKTRLIDEAVICGTKKGNLVHNDDIRWDIDYPEHWGLQRVRETFSFRKGLSITKANLEENGIPVISYGQVHSKKNTGVGLNNELIRFVNESYLSSNPSCLVETGDFIFADTSEDVTGCGNCAYVDWTDTIFAGYHSIIAHPDGSMNNKYLAYLFKSPTWRYQIRKKVNGVKVYSITQKMLKDTFILIPPISEQDMIVAHLDTECAKIDGLIEKMEAKIEQLHDMKKSLVADAVTGKIDVRGITIPEYEYVDEDADIESDDEDIEEDTEEQED